MAKTILVLGGLLQKEYTLLEKHFDLLRFSHGRNPEDVLQEYKNDIVGIVSSTSFGVSSALIDALPNLEIICQSAVGVDNIDLKAAKQRNISVTNTPDLVTKDTADIALALILGVARRTMEADLYIRLGKWESGKFGMGTTLTGKTVGVLGLGKIGSAIAKRASAFDMKIIYHNRSQRSDVSYDYAASVEDLAQKSDFLVCSCPGTAETEGIIDAAILQALGTKGFLINVARGSVVNEEDLLIALANKSIAGAGLDVFRNEPHVPDAMKTMDNVVLFPHIGTSTFETSSQMGQLVIANLVAHFKGDKLLTPVELK